MAMQKDSLTTLLEAVPLPTVLIGQSERILGANRRAQELLGKGISGRHFITALRQPTVLDAIEACLRDQQPRSTRYLTGDGRQDSTFVVTCSFVDTPMGAGVMVCFEDVSHLEQAEQMRRDFVANVSHELRSPLTALLGFIETLKGPARDDKEASDRFLSIMQVEAMRMERLVKDLLSLNRVESEERVRPTERIDVSQSLQAVVHATQPLADDASVKVELNLPDAPVMALGDADQLQQVFTNLIENAIKYGGAGNTVRLHACAIADEPTLRGPAVVISVQDEGPGIDEMHIPRLTERFYRVDSHRSREMGGTGLGLAIVKHIVNRHRGRLRVVSRLGEGSEFKVILPAGDGG